MSDYIPLFESCNIFSSLSDTTLTAFESLEDLTSPGRPANVNDLSLLYEVFNTCHLVRRNIYE